MNELCLKAPVWQFWQEQLMYYVINKKQKKKILLFFLDLTNTKCICVSNAPLLRHCSTHQVCQCSCAYDEAHAHTFSNQSCHNRKLQWCKQPCCPVPSTLLFSALLFACLKPLPRDTCLLQCTTCSNQPNISRTSLQLHPAWLLISTPDYWACCLPCTLSLLLFLILNLPSS